MKITVVGSGTMAIGISQVLIQCEDVVELNIIARSIEKAETVRINCLKYLTRMVRKGKISESIADNAMQKISLSEYFETVKDSKLVIEAVAEDFNIKFDLYKKISSICDR
jgi:3-hydroxybutyryl-CoA dehydrogenase